MVKSVRYFSLSEVFLYPKEKWRLVSVARAILILILFLNGIATPLSYNELDYTLFQSIWITLADIAIVLLLLPKFNLWLESKYKIKLSNGVKAIIILAVILATGAMLP